MTDKHRPSESEGGRRITVLLSHDDFRRFDEFCKERGYKKSSLLVRLIRELLDKEGAENRSGRS